MIVAVVLIFVLIMLLALLLATVVNIIDLYLFSESKNPKPIDTATVTHRVIQNIKRQELLTQSIEVHQSKFPDFIVMCEQNENLVCIYNELGQSIAALNIQLQVAQKLWQIDPHQAQESISEAYSLSGTIMREVRETVRTLNRETIQIRK